MTLRLAVAREVYERYRHLDHLLRDERWLPETAQGVMLRDCWLAVCAAVGHTKA